MTNFKSTKIIKNILINVTLTRFLGALFTVTLVAFIKYYLTGSLHINYADFANNVGMGLLG
jgi:hypothetical protein